MNIETIFDLIKEFDQGSHGSSNFDQDKVFVMGKSDSEFVPLRYIKKKDKILTTNSLHEMGFILAPYDILDKSQFKDWYEKQFLRKMSSKDVKRILIYYYPNHKSIFNALESIDKSYEILRKEHILLNSKNLPIQLGEWYAKCIFGLHQIKSSSQRGFDFEMDGSRVEVKVHWSDRSSPKGVKIKKSLVELSDHMVLIYENHNFMIRDICVLDSDFVLRRFADKGHTIFLKDSDIQPYFFSKSTKQFDKVKSKTALMTFASPNLAMKLEGRI